MLSSTPVPLPFHVAAPLGIPRPVSVGNFFGVTPAHFFRNEFPVPVSALANFDVEVFRPCQRSCAAALAALEQGWTGAGITDAPQRYCFLLMGKPTPIPRSLWGQLPKIPVFSVHDVMARLHILKDNVPEDGLFDLLTILAEDLPAAVWAGIRARYTWVDAALR